MTPSHPSWMLTSAMILYEQPRMLTATLPGTGAAHGIIGILIAGPFLGGPFNVGLLDGAAIIQRQDRPFFAASSNQAAMSCWSFFLRSSILRVVVPGGGVTVPGRVVGGGGATVPGRVVGGGGATVPGRVVGVTIRLLDSERSSSTWYSSHWS